MHNNYYTRNNANFSYRETRVYKSLLTHTVEIHKLGIIKVGRSCPSCSKSIFPIDV